MNVSVKHRCSTKGCENPPRPNQRTCREHHRIYMVAWRKKQRELLLAYRSVIEGVRANG